MWTGLADFPQIKKIDILIILFARDLKFRKKLYQSHSYGAISSIKEKTTLVIVVSELNNLNKSFILMQILPKLDK